MSQLIALSTRWPRLGATALALLFPSAGSAHERWILTPEQIAQWNALPKPLLYSEPSFANVAMVLAFLLFIVGWIRLGFSGARELFPDLQARLASYGEHVPRILRLCLAWLLISSAFGLEPRAGVEPWASPTLFAPDLELSALNADWAWLRWLEALLGVAILLGVYVRFCAVLLMLLGLLAGWLFGPAFLAYGGALLGVSIYLLLQGPGRHYPPLPTPAFLQGVQAWLAAQPRARAQAIMRVLAGSTMLYLGVAFKIMQPNLALAIITLYQVPVLSAAPEAFSLLMALVEVAAGVLLIAGILLRPLSLFLLAAFSLFALLLPETLTEHILFYGVMLSCLINSAGHWRRPVARDQPADILIVGGGVAALHAAMNIERLAGAYSHVKITLLHDDANFVLVPLLPEVVGGTVQPGNVANPIRRVVPRVAVVLGRLESIDPAQRRVSARRGNGERIQLGYSELVLAPVVQPNTATVAGMLAHACPFDSVGDALHIRKRLLDLVEEAEFCQDQEERGRLLRFAVVGSGELACSLAVEICQMLRATAHAYPVLRQGDWQVHLYEDADYVYSAGEQRLLPLRNASLAQAGVILHPGEAIAGLTATEILLADGRRQPLGLVVNATFRLADLRCAGSAALAWPWPVQNDLSLAGQAHVWVAAAAESDAAAGQALGKAAGYNAWAASQGYAARPFRPRWRWLRCYGLGRHSLCELGLLRFSSPAAWPLARLGHLLAMPGLEKNLRILIDWLLLIPFRSDLAVLAPAAAARWQRLRLEPGEEVFQQGDAAEMAYVVESGRLEILKDGHKTGELAPGDGFGEITQAHRRAETVRCIAACELTVLSQSDFRALAKGSGLLGKAMQRLALVHGASPQGLKRILYVSTMHAPMSDEEIIELGRLSSLNNNRLGLTGILISVHEYFFQILEGPEAVLDDLLEKIRYDARHRDVTVLSAEYGLSERLFSDWGMRTICLNDDSSVLMQAIRIMLRHIAQSHHIIGCYAQPAVLKLLTEGINPLAVPAQRTEKIVVYGNLAGFATLSEAHPVELAVAAANNYLEICSACVVEHGGQVARYLGDSFIAHFAPAQADAAIAACLDAAAELARLGKVNPLFRGLQPAFGLACGAVVEGNLGSSLKMDYTILGPVVDQAMQLEALARRSANAMVLSAAVRQQAQYAWVFQAAGEEADCFVLAGVA
jgi:NADH dehydrogenase FAD-containing subunit/class 3 adenylate cyclase/uncharacterized membrane protein YphA (DoxX/SURF4 family)